MKYIDGFREPRAAAALCERLSELGESLRSAGRTVNVMEVCGTHTMSIARHGIREVLPDNVDLISGPGCPVCVTPAGYVDAAIELARRAAIIVTFGDLMHVPGSETTLDACRASGCRVEVCYSPRAAVELAHDNPGQQVVFLAIGFETTVAPVVSLVDIAAREQLSNLSLLTAFKVVPPALEALLADPEVAIDAFLCPAHVSAIIGSNAYEPFAGEGGVPCVVAGFEPLDILLSMQSILEQLAAGEARVENEYSRIVKPEGNRKAQALITRLLEPVDAVWRGIGALPGSGLGLRDAYASFDAAKRFEIHVGAGREHPGCRCGDVIKGKLHPPECPLFATGCTPDHPVGPCMVSSEGTCSAYFKYSRMSA